jgi:hypothetical protein
MAKRPDNVVEFDIEKVRVDPERVAAIQEATKSKPKRRKAFVIFPDFWRRRLVDARATVVAYQLALALLEAARWKSSITVTSAMARASGVGLRGKKSAIRQLERAGLVNVERRARRNPIVTMLHLD